MPGFGEGARVFYIKTVVFMTETMFLLLKNMTGGSATLGREGAYVILK